VDFTGSAKTEDYLARLREFMAEQVFPAEQEYATSRRAAGPDDHGVPPVVERLKSAARSRGLWNLFLPPVSGLTNLEYAPIAELSGWSLQLAPEAMNCSPPDSGNMEVLHYFGTAEQKREWLSPLLDGTIRSAFAMTEPEVASSDASNIRCQIERDGDAYIINGHKWWISGLADPRCAVLIVMGKTDPEASPHRQQSLILVPVNSPGVRVIRSLPVFGWQDQPGHCEVVFEDVRVPGANLIGAEGDGFAVAQARLGPGRIHHCMRALGAAERALALMVERAGARVAFGKPLADQATVQEGIARSRLEIEQARLLCLKAAWAIDQYGSKQAKDLIAMIKIAAPRAATNVIDRAIQVYGGAGVSDDTPLARLYAMHRAMRIFDGPDEVHLRAVARAEMRTKQES
jgi:acyl-CoA dehydrogenase